MIEANNPEINVGEIMQKINHEVAKRKSSFTSLSESTSKYDLSKIESIVNYIEALLGSAEYRAIPRRKWPDKINRFPFNLSEGIQKLALKTLNFIFKDQREVNLNLIASLRQSVELNRQLIEEIQNLRSQVSNNIVDIDILIQKVDAGFDSANVERQNSIKAINEKIEIVDKRIEIVDEKIEIVDEKVAYLDKRLDLYDCEQEQEREQKQEDSKAIPHLPNFMEFQEENYLGSAIALSCIPIEEHYKYEKNDLFYYLFENVFYNSAVVKEKQKYYLKYINKSLISHPFLDAGCGRGEFIENLRLNQIKAQGIDLNQLEVEHLQQSGYDVYQSDILQFLEKSTDKYSGISALQVVEHLNFEYLNSFLKIAFEKIVMDGVIILETINPHSLYALSNFYQDPTHIKPLPPEMLRFLLEWHGFKKVKIIYSSLIPESLRVFPEQRMNYQDYALVGYKKL